ncbi:pepsin-like aspartic protease [Litorilituus sediminis]|uniref:A1 family peptidase n=1 Tax=Litorilituus sediminis TaxID=718192 RepID=A0A4P6P6L4_9GAMM|nr:pepsin-like aspartic protease [Litorilituus sediminis]QBG35829.1 A1 family peptidase [Litorilituus sediminis]
MQTPLQLPITNVYGKGDYSLVVHLGSEQAPVNLLIDSGSSTLVVKEGSYQASRDKHLTPTAIAQEVNYGIGGWNGPVIHSSITLSNYDLANKDKVGEQQVTLTKGDIAIVSAKQQIATFAEADGILGLAYHHLNKGFNLTSYFEQQHISPASTYPWPFNEATELSPASSDLKAFKKFLWQYPEHDIVPYFTELEEEHLVANKFAFYSKRSSVYVDEANKGINVATSPMAEIEPLMQLAENQGKLILGGGEEQTDLYQGEFQSIQVEHDVYYNVELISVQVGDKPAITAAPLEQSHVKSYFTNAIIDTGAGALVLTAALYEQVIRDLVAINADFDALLSPFKDFNEQYTGIDASLIDLAQWPTIYFNFVGEASSANSEGNISNQEKPTVQLACAPHTYWQLNTPAFGRASFKLLSQLPQWPNQSIIGLPLINNYYVVFDRTETGTGVVKFAQQK